VSQVINDVRNLQLQETNIPLDSLQPYNLWSFQRLNAQHGYQLASVALWDTPRRGDPQPGRCRRS
jgi:hypothetical protein